MLFFTADVKGIFHELSGMPLHGYEIHSGVITFDDTNAMTSIKPIYEAGEEFAEGNQNITYKMNVYGTYVHGVFDGDGIAAKIVEALLAKKGLHMEDVKTINFADYKRQQYDILADAVRKDIDMKKVYEILEAGV